jgi:hypothetical protein
MSESIPTAGDVVTTKEGGGLGKEFTKEYVELITRVDELNKVVDKFGDVLEKIE